MEKREYNILELVLNEKTNLMEIMGIKLGRELTVSSSKEVLEKLLKMLKQSLKKDILVIYCADPTVFFPSALEIVTKYKEMKIEFFILNGHVYFIKIFFSPKSFVLFKSIEALTGGLLENTYDHNLYLEEKKFEILPYTMGVKKADTLLKQREEEQLLYRKEKMRGAKDEMKDKLTYLNGFLNDLNANFSLIHWGWKYSYSISAISKDMFERKYNLYGIKLKNSVREDELLRQAYLGGRCEVFGNAYRGEEKIYHFDFKNMYGEVMLEMFPTGNIFEKKNLSTLEGPGFYYIVAESKFMHIPILPHKKNEDFFWNLFEDPEKKEKSQKILFTNGVFEGLYYKEEIELFLEKGGIIKEIKYAYLFSGLSKPIFKAFAKEIISLRNKTKNKIWKMILVSFYGRMGMRPQVKKTILSNDKTYDTDTKDKNILKEFWLNKYCLIEIEEKSAKEEVNSAVAYAAIITSKARIKLWKNMEAVKKHNGRMLYCDTDSIFAAFDSSTNILNTKMLDVFWDADDSRTEVMQAVFADIKSYSILTKHGWETKISGVPRNSIKFEDFSEKFYSQWLSAQQIYVKKKNLFLLKEWIEQKTIWIGEYDKRIFSKDKKKN